jgi:hypothetical protein
MPLTLADRRTSKRVALNLFAALSVLWIPAAFIGCTGGTTIAEDADDESEQVPMDEQLRAHVETLCADGPGGRSRTKPEAFARAAGYIRDELAAHGFTDINDEFVPGYGSLAPNIYVDIPGDDRPDEVVIIGAHYDNVPDSPGADDNASAVAVTIELAGAHKRASDAGESFDRTVRYILFTNEEAPYFNQGEMASQHHADQSRARGERVTSMISVEMVGFFSDEPGSQRYPMGVNMPGLPDRGDFIAIVTRLEDAGLERTIARAFRSATDLPAIDAALPVQISAISWSDHSSFWARGIPAAMVTDTSFLRNPYYHQPTDTPDTLDYERMTQVFDGLVAVVRTLATIDAEADDPAASTNGDPASP